MTPQMANAELATLIASWGERIGIRPGPGGGGHVFIPLNQPGGHILQMEPLRDEMLGGAGCAIWACGLPAWRASRVEPNIVLRDE